MQHPRRVTSIAAYSLLLGALLTGAEQGPAMAGSPDVITGNSPFVSCDVSAQEGTNYLNAEVEPWVDVNPSNPSNAIAGWQQDRWSNGGSRSLLSAYTHDGGRSWTSVVIPFINMCSGGTGDLAFERSSDPWVSISPNGTSYFMSLSFDNDRPDGGSGANAMLVSRSTDGGASWGPPVVLRRDTDGRIFNDKNAMTADPFNSRYVFAAWDQLFQSDLPQSSLGIAPQSAGPGHDGVQIARDRYRNRMVRSARSLQPQASDDVYWKGPSYLARTADGGLSWEDAKVIYDPGKNAQTIGNQIVVRNDGGVLVFFSELTQAGSTKIRFVRSNDHGRTFGNPVDAAVMNITATGTLTPDLREPVRDGNILFDVAIDRANGNLYLVWQDGRQGGVDRVAFSMSTNGGISWSSPVIISKTPSSHNRYRTQAFVPSVEVGASSKVFVTYYDFRNDRPGSKGIEKTDYWVVTCTPGRANCRTPSGWGGEARLTPQSFNMVDAPFAGGYFLGDYQGLVRQGSDVRAVFAVATRPGLTDMVTALVH